jgi:hypothetical protein
MTEPAVRVGPTDLATSAQETRKSDVLWKGIIPLTLLTLLWIRVFLSFAHVSSLPDGQPAGGDFGHNMGSAYVMKQGGNPYDTAELVRGEKAYLEAHGVPIFAGATDPATVWSGYPPLYFWLLQPFTEFAFPLIAFAWILVMGAALAVGALMCLTFLGWTARAFPALLFLVAPPTTLHLYYTNAAGAAVAMILAAVAISRRFPFAAGVLLSISCVKPQVGVPSFLLVALFSPPRRWRIVSGFSAGALSLFILTMLGPGPQSFVAWTNGLFGVSNLVGQQVNMVPLVGLYAGYLSQPLHNTLEFLTVAAALGLTVWYWRRLRGYSSVPFHLVAWLWPLWMLALPYAHFADEIVLLPAVLAVLGHNGRNIAQLGPALCVYLLYLSTALYNVEIGHMQLLSLPLIAVTILMYRHAVGSINADNKVDLVRGSRGDLELERAQPPRFQ